MFRHQTVFIFISTLTCSLYSSLTPTQQEVDIHPPTFCTLPPLNTKALTALVEMQRTDPKTVLGRFYTDPNVPCKKSLLRRKKHRNDDRTYFCTACKTMQPIFNMAKHMTENFAHQQAWNSYPYFQHIHAAYALTPSCTKNGTNFYCTHKGCKFSTPLLQYHIWHEHYYHLSHAEVMEKYEKSLNPTAQLTQYAEELTDSDCQEESEITEPKTKQAGEKRPTERKRLQQGPLPALQCPLCEKMPASPGSLLKHIEREHKTNQTRLSKENPAAYKIVRAATSLSVLEQGIDYQPKAPIFNCLRCNSTYFSSVQLLGHFRKEHPECIKHPSLNNDKAD